MSSFESDIVVETDDESSSTVSSNDDLQKDDVFKVPEPKDPKEMADMLLRLAISESDDQHIDMCKMFGNAEEFLVDGDALLMAVVGRNWQPRSPMSSLHIVSLVEQILARISQIGGRYKIVFFKQRLKHVYLKDGRLALLKQLLVNHLR